MSDPFQLLEQQPSGHVGPDPEATIREAFLRFHDENPHIARELATMARKAKEAGATKIGMKMLFEVLRWRRVLRSRGDQFKMNNNYAPYYARLVMFRHPELVGIFEIRALHGPRLTEDDMGRMRL